MPGLSQGYNGAFSPPGDGAGKMQACCGRCPARQDKRRQRRKDRIELVDFGLKPCNLAVENAQDRPLRLIGPGGRRQVSAEIEEFILEPAKDLIQNGSRGVEPGQTNAGIGLIHITIGRNPQVGLADRLTIGQACGSAIARARVDAVQGDQGLGPVLEPEGAHQQGDGNGLHQHPKPHELV